MKKYFWSILNILGYNVVMFFLCWYGNHYWAPVPKWWWVMQIAVNILLIYFLWKQIRIYRKHQQLKWLDEFDEVYCVPNKPELKYRLVGKTENRIKLTGLNWIAFLDGCGKRIDGGEIVELVSPGSVTKTDQYISAPPSKWMVIYKPDTVVTFGKNLEAIARGDIYLG